MFGSLVGTIGSRRRRSLEVALQLGERSFLADLGRRTSRRESTDFAWDWTAGSTDLAASSAGRSRSQRQDRQLIVRIVIFASVQIRENSSLSRGSASKAMCAMISISGSATTIAR